VASVIVLWSIQDILVWQRLFEARSLWQFQDAYQFWHQAFLVLLFAAGATQLRGRWIVYAAAATWTFANSGLADVLYYWLDFKLIPRNLPWLDSLHPLVLFHPATSASVLASAAAWLALWALAFGGRAALVEWQRKSALRTSG
jgi:hypothetical protein